MKASFLVSLKCNIPPISKMELQKTMDLVLDKNNSLEKIKSSISSVARTEFVKMKGDMYIKFGDPEKLKNKILEKLGEGIRSRRRFGFNHS